MPLYHYKCDLGHSFKKILTLEQFLEGDGMGAGFLLCNTETCSAPARRVVVVGKSSSQTMEVVDNGIQTRPVERLAEAERIFKEREQAHDQKYKIEEDPQE